MRPSNLEVARADGFNRHTHTSFCMQPMLNGVPTITKAKLMEVSFVVQAANPEARVLAIRSIIDKSDEREARERARSCACVCARSSPQTSMRSLEKIDNDGNGAAGKCGPGAWESMVGADS
jgi:hypothetical protein